MFVHIFTLYVFNDVDHVIVSDVFYNLNNWLLFCICKKIILYYETWKEKLIKGTNSYSWTLKKWLVTNIK